MWFDTDFDKIFRRCSDRFFSPDDVFGKTGDQIQTYGPYYYGYEMTVGPDGKPHVREWGNVRPNTAIGTDGVRNPYVDEILDEKQNILKLVAEMPGIEKSDIKVNVADGIATISAEHNERKYKSQIPLKYEVDENSAKAKYSNGVLEVSFKLAKEKPKGKEVIVE